MKTHNLRVLFLPLALGAFAGVFTVRCTPDAVTNPVAPVTTGGTSVTNPTPATGVVVTRTNYVWVTNDKYQYLAGYGTSGGALPFFGNPTSIQVVGTFPNKFIYISDSGNNVIHYFTYDGTTIVRAGNSAVTTSPQMLSIDPSGRLLVTETTPRVTIWTNIGIAAAPALSLTNTSVSGSQFGYMNTGAVMGSAVITGTTLLVADRGGNRIESFTNIPSTGNFVTNYCFKVSQTFAFINLAGPTVIREDFFTPGAYLVVDSGNNTANNTQNRILSVDVNFNLLRVMGNPTTTPGVLFNPVDIATNKQRQYLVVDRGNHRVVRLNADGYLLEVIGGPLSSSDNGKFYNPYGIATDRDDLMYVVDQGNNRFQVFTNTRGTNLVTNVTRVWSNF